MSFSELRPCILWAREPGRIRSPLWGTDTEGFTSPTTTNLMVVSCGWSLTEKECNKRLIYPRLKFWKYVLLLFQRNTDKTPEILVFWPSLPGFGKQSSLNEVIALSCQGWVPARSCKSEIFDILTRFFRIFCGILPCTLEKVKNLL